jgi:hypothetical protein
MFSWGRQALGNHALSSNSEFLCFMVPLINLLLDWSCVIRLGLNPWRFFLEHT